LWIRFLRHPLIAPHLPESRYPTLYGVFPTEEVPRKKLWNRLKDLEPRHSLLLDREKRELYLCPTGKITLLLALMEPEDADRHWVFIDGLFHPVNPAAENYKVPPRKELAGQLISFLDGWFDDASGRFDDASLEDDFEETAADSEPRSGSGVEERRS
ncbi:MAG TPA: hypothetical protein VGR55_11320, partial [Candidatus Acidoferrum sp.]|nr:hypothetical protein [Candidatus Acidoferrum sp.]